eukprot:scaffold7067_cov139-Isochrysis_galbana.AAC.2
MKHRLSISGDGDGGGAPVLHASPLDGCRCASGRARIGPHAAGKALANQNRGRHRMVPSIARPQGKRKRPRAPAAAVAHCFTRGS